MAKLFNRARMTVTSTGTGTLTLGSAASGFQTFASAGVANGDVVSYAIEDGANWEIGTGTYTSSGTTLSRTVTQSYDGTTYGTSAISVTTSAQVYITALVADLVNASNLTSGTLAASRGGAGTVSGILKANGSGTVSAASSGTDYVDPGGLGVGVSTALGNTVNASGGIITYSTFAPASGKTLTVSNSITLAGTDSTTMTFPSTSSTVLTTGNTATITKGYTVTPASVTTGSFTVTPANGNYQYVTNNGAYTITAPASDCAVDLLVTNGASAGATTFSGFTVGSSTGSSLTTTNGNRFLISIRRINSISTYSIYALQ